MTALYGYVYLCYAETGCPASGLTVDVFNGDKLVSSAVVGGLGYAGTYDSGLTLKIRRGRHAFLLEVALDWKYKGESRQISITRAQWPSELAGLRELLLDEKLYGLVTKAANRILESFRDSAQLNYFADKTQHADTQPRENPHIVAGALLCALAVSHDCVTRTAYYKATNDIPNDTERDNYLALQTCFLGVQDWLRKRQHPANPGYFLRYAQVTPGDRTHPDNWRAEPSLDEYSGLIFGLTWSLYLLHDVYSLEGKSCFEAHTLRRIGQYLQSTHGWLVRPETQDFTLRGADLPVYSYSISRVLDFRNRIPIWLNDQVKGYLDNSLNNRESLPPDARKQYDDLLGPLEKYRQIREKISFWEWAAKFVGAALGGPVGYGLVAAATHALNQQIEDHTDLVSDETVWKTLAASFAPPASIDAGGFNVHIFDRFSLAASWMADATIEETHHKRSLRRISGDRWGWQLLSAAGRIWFGSDFSAGDIATVFENNALIALKDTPPPANLETLEGFVSSWAIMCVALDMDVGLDWRDKISLRDETIQGLAAPMLPRFEFQIDSATLTQVKEPIEEPSLWVVAVMIESSSGVRRIDETLGVNCAHVASRVGATLGAPLAVADLRDRWPAMPSQATIDVLLVIVAWERDYTPQEGRYAGIKEVETMIRQALTDVSQPAEVLAQRVRDTLHGRLPRLYANPIAPPGSKYSDDDFIGAEVVTLSVAPGQKEQEKRFDIMIEWTPQPYRRESKMRCTGLLRYKGL